LVVDVTDIVHYCQPANDFVLTMQRKSKNMHRIAAYAEERALFATLRHGSGHVVGYPRENLS
jgi:hypothetical protein